MTVCVEQHEGKNHYVSLEIEQAYGHAIYVVQVCQQYENGLCGYPLREMRYPITEKKKAYGTYRRYIRNYCR